MLIPPPLSNDQLRPGESDLNVGRNGRSGGNTGRRIDDSTRVKGSRHVIVLSVDTPAVVSTCDSGSVHITLVLVSDVVDTADLVVKDRTLTIGSDLVVVDGKGRG